MATTTIITLYLLIQTIVSCSSSTIKDGNRTVAIDNPALLRLLPKDIVERGRSLPQTPPLGTSTYHMNRLAMDEIKVATKLADLAQAVQKVSEALRIYASSWDELARADVGAKGWVEHPLHTYALTKHVSRGWPAVEDSLRHLKSLSGDVDSLLERRNTTGVPTHEDLASVAGGLARLHDFYSFNLTAFSNAHLMTTMNEQPMSGKITPTVWDLYRIGKEAVKVNIWNSGVDFLRTATEKQNATAHPTSWPTSCLSTSSSCSSFESFGHPFDDEEDILHLSEALRKTTKMHDQVLERKGSRSRQHSTHERPIDKTLARKKKYHKKEQIILGTQGPTQQGHAQYIRLCRGEDLRPPNTTSNLYCHYLTNGSPNYLIGPLKMEVHSLSPYVVTIEGVVTPSEAVDLKNTSSFFLEKSSTFKHNGKNEVSYQRTSSTGWLWEHNSPHLPKLTDRIESLTGLNAIEHLGSETYQVVNYGVGGHYTVHMDATGAPPILNRIATFLIYMTDVPQGGSTVFPWLGIGVTPKIGKALLWYSMNKSGQKDLRTDHAACPVLMGDKWIINKWMYYGGQMHNVPCSMDGPDVYVQQPLG